MSLTNRNIPPRPTFPPPSLPTSDGELTTYTRTRSVSPAPFIVSHDTFIRSTGEQHTARQSSLRRLEVGRPPLISVEPATPPVLEERNSEKPRENGAGKHSGQQEIREGKVKRRGSKKVRSKKIDYEAKFQEEKSDIGAPSKIDVTELGEHNTENGDKRTNYEDLTEKEKNVITEVLNSRQTRSRPQSRTEERESPGLATGESYDAVPLSSWLGGANNNKEKMSPANETLILQKQRNSANIENEATPGAGDSKNNDTTKQPVSESPETTEITTNTSEKIVMENNNEFDPFTIVENIADLTVEHLKETLLGSSEQETQNDSSNDIPSRSKDIVSVSNRDEIKQTDAILDKLQQLSSDMKTLEVGALAHHQPSAKSMSSSPQKKKCRLRVVKKEEGTEKTVKSEEPSTESSNSNNSSNKDQNALHKIVVVTPPHRSKRKERKEEQELAATHVKITRDQNEVSDDPSAATPDSAGEHSQLSVGTEKTKISNDSSSSTNIVDKITGPPSRVRKTKPGVKSNEPRISGASEVTAGGRETVENDYEVKKREAVNIPTIRTFETVQIPTQNETKNDTTSRGKLVVSCLVVVGVALLSYLMFSVLEVRRSEPRLSGAEEEYDYGYFRIKEWP